MKRVFTASNVVILNFSHLPDSSHTVIPPEAHAEYPKKLTVRAGSLEEKVGWANLRRQGNQLLADMTLTSIMDNEVEALKLMRTLYPAVELTVSEAHLNTILKFRLDNLFLTYCRNDDLTIKPLGELIRPRVAPSEMH